MNTVEILKKAKERIGTPDRWYQGALHDPYNPKCLCVVGALREVTGLHANWGEYGDTSGFWDHPSIKLLTRLTPLHGLAAFNDNPSTTHADIMALFDRAIAAAEADQ